MCTDLETQADSYAVFISRDLDPDFITVGMVRQMLAEAYKQGYMDATELVCCNKECNQRIPPRPYRVGDKVTAKLPNGNTMKGRIAEVKWGGWCDIDFGNGCMRYDVPPCEIELLETD